jgi:hypothetical protein
VPGDIRHDRAGSSSVGGGADHGDPFVGIVHLRLGALQAYYLKRFKCVIDAARPFKEEK